MRQRPSARGQKKKPYRYLGTGFKTNVGSATVCSSPPSHCQTRAASCSETPQAHAKATHALAKRQSSCQVRDLSLSRARCRRMSTSCGARRQAAGNAIACPTRPIKRTFGSLCLPCNLELILERMQVPQTRPRECRSLPTRPAAACRHGSLVSGADLRKQPTKWCNLAAAAAVAQISAPSLRPVHRRGTLGFPGEGPFHWTEFLDSKVETRLEKEEEEDADEEKEKEKTKRKADESEILEPTSSTSVQLELEHPVLAPTTFRSHITMDHVCLWRQ